MDAQVKKSDWEGQGLLEYALVMILVSVAAVSALMFLGVAVIDFFGTVPEMFTP